jgi:small subunit ribosomal protein S1
MANDKILFETPGIDWVELEGQELYSADEKAKMIKEYVSTVKTVEKNQIISGTVVGKTDKDVVLNIGFKSDGLVGLTEFRGDGELEVGSEVEVFVVTEEDKKGQLVLSRKNAKLIRAWENIVNAHEDQTVVEGKVICKTKGGLVAEVFGFECFLPGSQIDVKPIIDYDYYVGKTMEFKVVKINEAIKNAVVSHKALIESELESQRQDIIAKLEKGQVLEGTVKNITDFGAFIDLGGVDGLLYLSDISWGRISHPSEVLELNQTLNVAVLDFDDNKKRISLGLKQLQSHPWDVLEGDVEIGTKVSGKVVNIEDYGAFLEIKPGVEGLVHVSEISWGLQPINPKDFFTLGDSYEAVVVTIDREERKMSLSIKQTTNDPWAEVETKYAEGSQHKGKVISLTPYGAFLELEGGIGGLVHVSDFSWTKKIAHPSEFCKVGEDIGIVVLKIDIENRRLSLGHKQLEENPWETFENVFPVGSIHQGTVVRVVDGKDAIVQLQYGLEGNCFVKNLKKEDGSTVAVDETIDFKVSELDPEKKKIIVSHTRTWQEDTNEEVAPKKKGGAKKSSTGGSNKSFGDKTTLGDLDALSQLKDQMDGKSGDDK